MIRPRLMIVLAATALPCAVSPAFSQTAVKGETTVAALQPEKPRTVIRPVDWDAVRQTLQGGTLLRLRTPRSAGAQKFDDCRMPILLPTEEGLYLEAAVYPQSHFYTAFIAKDGYTIEIVGTRIAREFAERGTMARAMRGAIENDADSLLISRSEFGIDVSLSRYGVAYSISILCEDPGGDAHCSDEAYIRKLVQSLAYVGGQPEKNEALTEGRFWEDRQP